MTKVLKSFTFLNLDNLDNLDDAMFILTNSPTLGATHFHDNLYYNHWGEDSWVKYYGGEILPCKEPEESMRIDLDDLRKAVGVLCLIKLLGGYEQALKEVNMAKIMRTMFVGRFCLRYVEHVLDIYKANMRSLNHVN